MSQKSAYLAAMGHLCAAFLFDPVRSLRVATGVEKPN
jgi:hypothetical protein